LRGFAAKRRKKIARRETSGPADKCVHPEWAREILCRTFSAESDLDEYQTFHVWLLSIGGFTAEEGAGTP